MKRVCVVVNKWWELDPIIDVLLSDYARPQRLPWPELNRHPRPRPDPKSLPPIDPRPAPRATFRFPAAVVEMWCISDLLEHLPDTSANQSSTERKAERLASIVAGGKPDLTIAVGTAARGSGESDNGNVVIGTRTFMFDGHPNNPDSRWTAGPFGTVVASTLSPALFEACTAPGSIDVRKYFLVPPLNPAPTRAIISVFDQVALGDMNVTSASEYALADSATIAAFTSLATSYPIGSIETTHPLIRAICGDAFLFISGIANGVGLFGREVYPRLYAQNTVAAHNAGVVLADMLPRIATSV